MPSRPMHSKSYFSPHQFDRNFGNRTTWRSASEGGMIGPVRSLAAIACLGVAQLGETTRASAADIGPRPLLASDSTWTGLYAGINVGGLWALGDAQACNTVRRKIFARGGGGGGHVRPRKRGVYVPAAPIACPRARRVRMLPTASHGEWPQCRASNQKGRGGVLRESGDARASHRWARSPTR
jgi:hypothetical protein